MVGRAGKWGEERGPRGWKWGGSEGKRLPSACLAHKELEVFEDADEDGEVGGGSPKDRRTGARTEGERPRVDVPPS